MGHYAEEVRVPSGFLRHHTNGSVQITAPNDEACHEVLKELSDKKQELTNRKRDLSGEVQQIREAFATYSQFQGVTYTGLSTLACFIRLFQQMDREAVTRRVNTELMPREQLLSQIKSQLVVIDKAATLVTEHIRRPKVKFACPDCQRALSAPARMEGRTVDCPNCKTSIVIPRTSFAFLSPPIVPIPSVTIPRLPPAPTPSPPPVQIARIIAKPVPKPIVLQPVPAAPVPAPILAVVAPLVEYR